MKGTILYAKYDESTGVSVVTKQTKYGTFTRSVRVHPQDKDVANQYDGCYFAELKCDIAAYKERAKFMRERAKGIQHAFDVISYANDQANPHYLNIMSHDWYLLANQAYIAWHNAKQAYETYTILKESYNALIETTLRQRREMRERIKRKHQDN